MYQIEAHVLPILTDENFRFPNKEVLDGAYPAAQSFSANPDVVLQLVQQVATGLAWQGLFLLWLFLALLDLFRSGI